MKIFRVIVALLLVALWLPTSSHTLLETAGLIHEQHNHHDDHHTDSGSHEHNHGDHDAADGLCRLVSAQIKVPAPVDACVALVAFLLVDLQSKLLVEDPLSGPSPPGQAPPEFSQQWQFSHRAALPARAPSFAS